MLFFTDKNVGISDKFCKLPSSPVHNEFTDRCDAWIPNYNDGKI